MKRLSLIKSRRKRKVESAATPDKNHQKQEVSKLHHRPIPQRAAPSFKVLLSEAGLPSADLANVSGHGVSDDEDEESRSNLCNISEAAKAAVEDFTLQLKFWGKPCFDEEAFNQLLDDIGYARSRDGLFDDLLQDMTYADPNFDLTSRTISVDSMCQLYASEPYKIPEEAVFNSGEVLMSYVEALFRKADTSGDNVLDFDEVKQLLGEMFGLEHSEEVIEEAFRSLDLDGDGQVDLEEFKSFMLKANVNVVSEVSDVNDAILLPSQTSDLEFVTELETYCKTHR